MSGENCRRPPYFQRGGRGRPQDSRRDGGATELISGRLRIFHCLLLTDWG